MAVERFSRADFEDALPRDKKGKNLWERRETIGHEYTYAVPIINGTVKSGELEIRVHSSVSEWTGYADSLGENSIRLYLYSPKYKKSLGKTESRWITRVSGWDKRMIDQLRVLYARGLKSSRCKKCGELQGAFTAKTAKNKGRQFRVCLNDDCKEWGGWIN